MNRATQKPLGGFEVRLLRELREVVAEGVAPPAIRHQRSLAGGGWLKRRWPIAVAAGLAAAFAALLLAGSPFGGSDDGRAWAVTSHDDGTVTVEIDSLSDADGLQRELRQAGVPAVVQYIPPGRTCGAQALSPGAVTQSGGDGSTAASPRARSGGQGLGAETAHEGKAPGSHGAGDHRQASEDLFGGRRAVQITTKPDGGIQFTIDAAGHPGETLLVRSQGLAPGQAPAAHPAAANAGSAISVSHVRGEARPCRLVHSTTR
jgi:hypothetical protein